jgi:EmrB/QacA subfamily drug resistance transporter
MYTVFALMLANFLTAVDVTIVDTAMPRIVGSLGGFSMLTWLVTAYMLTSTATVPLYGKMADLYGRKSTFTIGAVIFVIGSALCGLSQSMTQLIIFRAIQGVGAGAVLPTVQTIIGDIFTPAERAKVQGWFSGVWGFSAVTGPLLGGLITDHLSWRYLFFINLPLGIIAIVMVWRHLEERLEKRKVQIDYIGSITMTLGVTALLLALLTGGTQYPWGSVQVVGLLSTAVFMLSIFIWQEGRAPDPMLPLSLFGIPMIGVGALTTFMIGGIVYGISVYLPLWAQGVQGFSATRSGASLLWLSIGWPLSAVIASRLIMRVGVRPVALIALGFCLTGVSGLVVMGRTMDYIPEVLLATTTFLIGCGMGPSTLAIVLGVQNSVEWAQRGVATASLQFFRTLGGLIWVSTMGGVMNRTLLGGVQAMPGIDASSTKEASEVANRMLDPHLWDTLPVGQLELLRSAFAAALRNVHLLMLVAAVLSFAIALMLPRIRFNQPAAAAPGVGEKRPM